MIVKSVIATTHEVDNTIITKEALEKAANDINNGAKPFVSVEHNRTIPPIGKVLRAWVEPMADGESKLLSEYEVYESYEEIQLSDGIQLFQYFSKNNDSPFAGIDNEVSENNKIALDEVNFTNHQIMEEFITEIEKNSFYKVDIGYQVRRSILPDPEIIITLSQSAALLYIGKKIGDKVINKIGDEIGNDFSMLYKFIKQIVVKFAKYAIPKNRPKTYIIQIPGDPLIQFAAKTNVPHELLDNLQTQKIKVCVDKAYDFKENVGASKIQFFLNKKGDWELNYILTNKGNVIGTEKSFKKQREEIIIYNSKVDNDNKLIIPTK
ncbi:MAG: hypothetical protein GY756_02430 [bacterium]|nr:hypothetical protein [bacterium]